MTRVALLGVPYDASSSFLRGAAHAPPAIRAALASPSSNMWTELGVNLADHAGFSDAGDLALSDDAAASRAAIGRGVAQIATTSRVLALGGDHSVAYPIMRATAAEHRNVTLVQFDAHPDLYDVFEGDRFSHACPFARILEEGLVTRLVQIGVRGIAGEHRDQAARFGVDMIDMRRFAAGERPRIGGPVYVSLDLDALDPAFAPGVSHREPGGLSVRDVIGVLHALPGPIIGADVVEYNPSQDLGGVTAMVAAKLVKELAGRMLE